MLANAINEARVADIQCLVTDSNNNVTNKHYYVTLGADTTAKDMQQDASSLVKASFPGATSVFANGETDNADNVKVIINFYDNTEAHAELGYSIVHEFAPKTPFDWFVRLNDDLGDIISVEWDTTKFPPDQFSATTQSPGGEFESGVYVVGHGPDDGHGTGTGFDAGTEILVKAYFDIESYPYQIKAKYEKLNAPTEFDETIYNREGQLGLSIPTNSDLEFLMLGGDNHAHGDGWVVAKATDASITAGQQPQVEVELHRCYHILQFDCTGGINGPAAIFIKNGEHFSTVASWHHEDGKYYPGPEPTRNAYTFNGWKYTDAFGVEHTIAKGDDWADLEAPGAETTIYEAQWVLQSQSDVNIVLVYWAEKPNSTDYDYVMERYDRVDYSKIGSQYTLPVKTGTYDTTKPYEDRRYPQVRSGSDEYYLSGALEKVPTAPDYTFEQLFTYNKEKTEAVRPVIEADGSTICNIYLQRKIFAFNFHYSSQDHYLYGK